MDIHKPLSYLWYLDVTLNEDRGSRTLIASGQVVKKFQGGWWIYHNGRLVPVVYATHARRTRRVLVVSYHMGMKFVWTTAQTTLYYTC